MMYGGLLTKTEINPVSVFRVFDLLYIQLKPYESKLSTALTECKAVARRATRKNRYGDKQNKNRWGCNAVCTTRKTYASTTKIKTVGALKLWATIGKRIQL